jgi:hypothetical protein
MALDMSKVKQRLEALKTTNSKSTSLWKPTGKHVVRIVPYTHNAENPFIELLFHYGVNNKTYLSPSSFNRPDPIVEFANKLKKAGDKESWKEGRKLEPKMRTYVPIIVRGEEDQGVRFWGMGKQVYQEILGIIADPDYGDITDLKAGRDIGVEFKSASETATGFPETAIRVKPNQTIAFDPSNKALLEKFKNQKNILELFPELSYDELAKVMDEWLNAPQSDETPSAGELADSAATPADDVVPVAKTIAASGKKVSATATDVASDFDALFATK